MINETQILLAVIGSIGLLSSLAVVSRAASANDRYERRLRKQLQVCEVYIDPATDCHY